MTERHAALFAAFSLACLRDSALLADIPHNSELILIPDDDPELAAYSITRGKHGVDAGRDVYFRHVCVVDFLGPPEELGK
jgi:hypothetical protein